MNGASATDGELRPGSDESLDVLSNSLRILQRRRGHRATTDDLLVAWAGARVRPDARQVLDLGTGKGTVALLLCRLLPDCRVVGLEAFAQSHALALRNARLNALADRFAPHLLDLRDSAELLGDRRFELITGAPPFMPLGSGVLPADPQRAAGRFELRGGVEDYCRAAARHLTPAGRAVILMDGNGRRRGEAAMKAAGLGVERVVGVCPRPTRPATYAILIGGHPADIALGEASYEAISMRPPVGDGWSAPYRAIRDALDLPGRGPHPPTR